MSEEKGMYFGNHGAELFELVKELLGPNFDPKFRKTGVTFFGSKGRILKLVYRKKHIEVEFNVPVSTIPELEVYSEAEARNKKLGTCQWLYRGDNPTILLDLVKEALVNY